MAANDAIYVEGTELQLAATGTTSSVADGSVAECTNDDRQPTDNAGYPLGKFEFETSAGGFSAAPTSGAAIHLYEQKINSDAEDAPDVSTSYLHDYIGSFRVKPADEQQRISIVAPIHLDGAKYWIQWEDGGSGTASLDAGWELRLTPITLRPATS